MSELPPLNDATALAVERTRMGHDRTLMAWVRTAISLISFGFTIYKFFQYLRESAPQDGVPHVSGPRHFGLVMILTGLITLILATIQYRADIAQLEQRYGPQPRSLAAALAMLIGALGVIGLALVYLQR